VINTYNFHFNSGNLVARFALMGLSKMKINPELMVEFWQVSQETQRNLTRLLEHCELLEPHSLVGKKNERLSDYLREHEALGEGFHVAMSLKDFCTIKYEEVGDVDASSHEGGLIKPQDDFEVMFHQDSKTGGRGCGETH
jgi:hypothetical protein